MDQNLTRMIPAVCISGTHSGCGKTTVSLGIMSALVRRGLRVQPYKVGPDFIDPGHHRRVTGRDSHNLDSWMMERDTNTGIFQRYLHDADAAVVEGVMGLFDGFSGKSDAGSTALMAKWLDLPVILVIDARSMARSAAAVALGFLRFDPDLRVKGIIFNRVGSRAHEEMLREAVQDLPGCAVYGCLPREKALEIPSRHLGLLTEGDFMPQEGFARTLGQRIEDHVDLDGLLSSISGRRTEPREPEAPARSGLRIAIALDEAFCFYYQENLRLLRESGAELVTFSPIRSTALPEGIRGIILGGGYPELHCEALTKNRGMLDSIRTFALEGGPVYAECGGFMYLMQEITDTQGKEYPMAGLFPMKASMEHGLHALGYREIVTGKASPLGPPGMRIRGHEFHYSRIDGPTNDVERIYSMHDRKRNQVYEEGYLHRNVLGSYVHLHWGSNPDAANHFVEFCRNHQAKRPGA